MPFFQMNLGKGHFNIMPFNKIQIQISSSKMKSEVFSQCYMTRGIITGS